MSKFREMTPEEQNLVRKLFQPEFRGKQALLKQLDNSLVRQIDDNGSLEFHVQIDWQADVNKSVPTEAESKDVDGMPIYVLLHIAEGKLKELEIYRADSAKVLRRPDPDEIQLAELG